MSLRNRELLNLVVVGVLTALGFASVYIARQVGRLDRARSPTRRSSSRSTSPRTWSRGYAVPYADPYLLPMAALLTAVGLTEIYRLGPDDAFRQGVWIVVARRRRSRGTLWLLRRDYRRLESYKYLFGLTAIGLLVLPALPGIGADRQRRPALDRTSARSSSSPASSRRSA